MYVRRADTRGVADHGWLNSHHSFSFGGYYDPAHMGWSQLRVINDDVVSPGGGFQTHGHQDMEIISYVISGALAHKDSEGNTEVIPAGDIQIMSAGTGIRHSEFNASNTEPVNFLQMWVLPGQAGVAPRYQQKSIHQHDIVTPIVTPTGSETAVAINADVSLSQIKLPAGETLRLGEGPRQGYLHMVAGDASAGELSLGRGDAVGVEGSETLTLTTQSDVTALWFDLP